MSLPVDSAEAAARMGTAPIPEPVVAVARDLTAAGHQAVLVGGAVRDHLLGRPHGDWDIGTSATPDEVQGLFPRTIPTGIQHGTVTVLVGKGETRDMVEVTTFRGEGAYHDGRRPSEVHFHRDLAEDLARRDFTVNAFAWDPVREVFTDLYGGLEDLHSGVIRAVGVALERFTEDGLRTMRAVRFCATLGFALEPDTQAAIPGALSVLDQVSRERVLVELLKLLGSPRPSLGLRPMASTGMWPHVLIDLDEGIRTAAIEAVDTMGTDPIPRLARLLLPLAESQGDAGRTRLLSAVETLKPSREQRARVAALTGPHALALRDGLGVPPDPAQTRATVAALGAKHLDDALAVLQVGAQEAGAIRAHCEGVPLTVRELSIGGKELIAAGVLKPGPGMGDVLDGLLRAVWADPGLNGDRDRLLARARALVSSSA